jgi:hypothetical protein
MLPLYLSSKLNSRCGISAITAAVEVTGNGLALEPTVSLGICGGTAPDWGSRGSAVG